MYHKEVFHLLSKYILILILCGIAAVCLLSLLRNHLPNRRIFALFCLTLAAAAGLTFYTYQTRPVTLIMSDEEKYEIQQQQQIISDWYTGYKKDIEELDHNWRQYHRILSDFKNDNISIQTTYTRLTRLENDASRMKDTMEQLEPPNTVSDANYNQLAAIIKKSRTYATEQYQTIAHTRAAADPAHLLSNQQEEQSRRLEEVMIQESPVGLFTADEISAIRDNLAIPDEN